MTSAQDPSFAARALGFGAQTVAEHVLQVRGTAWQVESLRRWSAAAGELTRQQLDRRSAILRSAIRGAAGLSIAVGLATALEVQHAFWVVLGTLSVLRSSARGTGETALRAVLGTAFGVVIGAAVLIGLGTNPVVLWTLLPITILVAAIAPSFAAGQAGFTLVVVVLFTIIAPAGLDVGLIRIEDVALGCAVSVVAGALFWPRGAAVALGLALDDAYGAASDRVRGLVHTLTGRPMPDQKERALAARQRLDLAFRQFLAEPGAKRLGIDEVAALAGAATRLRLVADSLEELCARDVHGRLPPGLVAAGAELRAVADGVDLWYRTVGDLLAGRRVTVPPADPPDSQLPDDVVGHLRSGLREADPGGDEARAAPAVVGAAPRQPAAGRAGPRERRHARSPRCAGGWPAGCSAPAADRFAVGGRKSSYPWRTMDAVTDADRFSPATRAWFDGAFEQADRRPSAGAWEAIGRGDHTLVVAPTGSGKTLAAFLWSLDRLAATPPPDDPKRRCRVLYVSPLKALAVDVERNLRAPLAGIRQAATRLGLPLPDVQVGLRSGDTAGRRAPAAGPPPAGHPDHHARVAVPDADQRRPGGAARRRDGHRRRGARGLLDQARRPPGASAWSGSTQLLARPAQRVGLSATVRPVEEVARFLAGGRDVTVVQPPAQKSVELAGRRPGRGHVPARRADRRGARVGGRGRAPDLDLAGGRGAGARPGRAAPVDDRVRQLAPAGRAADRPAQRARLRAAVRGDRAGPLRVRRAGRVRLRRRPPATAGLAGHRGRRAARRLGARAAAARRDAGRGVRPGRHRRRRAGRWSPAPTTARCPGSSGPWSRRS